MKRPLCWAPAAFAVSSLCLSFSALAQETEPLNVTPPTSGGRSHTHHDPAIDEHHDGEDNLALDASQPLSYVDLGVGTSSANSDGPMLACMAVNPWWRLSLSACGTGSNIWREGTGREMSHYLLNYRITRLRFGGFSIEPQVGAGFAELQLGDEPPGFAFGDTQVVNEDEVSTAGGAAAASLRILRDLPYNFEALGTLTAGAGYFSQAESLYIPQRAFQPFFSFTLGVGY